MSLRNRGLVKLFGEVGFKNRKYSKSLSLDTDTLLEFLPQDADSSAKMSLKNAGLIALRKRTENSLRRCHVVWIPARRHKHSPTKIVHSFIYPQLVKYVRYRCD